VGTRGRVCTAERRERVGNHGLLGVARLDPAEPEASTFERGLIVPPFAERLGQIDDRRTANLGLDVVPGRLRAECGVEHLSLRVTFVTLVVATPVAEIDTTDEGDVVVVALEMQEQHQLLVVRPTAPDPRVQEEDSTGIIHHTGKIARLLLVETKHRRVGAPKEPSDLNASAREAAEQSVEARTIRAKELIVVSSPIKDQQLVPNIERGETTDESREIRGPVDQWLDMVAGGPGEIRLPTMALAARPIAALLRREEPIGRTIHPVSLVMDDDLRHDADDSVPRDDELAEYLLLFWPTDSMGADAVALEDAELAGDQVQMDKAYAAAGYRWGLPHWCGGSSVL
jgi:hypothetical protein